MRASGHAPSSSERAGDEGTRWGGLPPLQTPPLGVVSEAPHGWVGARKRVFSESRVSESVSYDVTAYMSVYLIKFDEIPGFDEIPDSFLI